MAAAADGDDEGDEVGDPAPSLVRVDGPEAEEGYGKGDEAGDDDADGDAHFFGVEGGEGLSADDGGEEAEAGDGRGVEEEGDGDEVFPGEGQFCTRTFARKRTQRSIELGQAV